MVPRDRHAVLFADLAVLGGTCERIAVLNFESTYKRLPSVGWRNKAYASVARMALVKLQLRRLGKGKRPKPDASPMLALIRQQILTKRRTRLYRAWVSQARGEPAGA